MKRTKQEISMSIFGYDIVIPKGTPTTNKTACGIDPNYNFIADLSWIDKKNQYGLWHDAYYYGINIAPELLEEVHTFAKPTPAFKEFSV